MEEEYTLEPDAAPSEKDEHILKLYEDTISYYWQAAHSNEQKYRLSQSGTIILGALVTLSASLSAAEIVTSIPWLKTALTIATPVLAAILTIILAVGQQMGWDTAWRNAIANAERLENQRGEFLATDPAERNHKRELARFQKVTLDEAQAFDYILTSDEVSGDSFSVKSRLAGKPSTPAPLPKGKKNRQK